MLSPLLSNIVLDDLDKELEQRGHRFARYADDFVILVKSQRAGERVMVALNYGDTPATMELPTRARPLHPRGQALAAGRVTLPPLSLRVYRLETK